jgi:Predicted membrane protein (DUF2142)
MSKRTTTRPLAKNGARRSAVSTPPKAPPAAGTRLFTRRAVTAHRVSRNGRTGGTPVKSLRPWDALLHIPRAAWACALIACLNAACWSVIMPPFEVPDEPSHYAYVQHLVETGSLPDSSNEEFTPAEEVALTDLHLNQVSLHPQNIPISTPAEQRQLEHDLAQPYPRTGNANAGVANAEPPLYYALEAIPYGLASGGTVLDRLALMRLLSALMGGLTALFVFLFIREALPGEPWAWTVGGLGVALAPLLGFMSGAVNPDALLFAVSAALFYCLARGFRRGLSSGLAVALGAVIAIGFMTKLNFIGLLPGAILGLLVLCAREARTSRRAALRRLALAGGVGASPILLYILINVLSGRPGVGTVSDAIALTGHTSILKELSYIWQFYLPRLPGMTPDFHGLLTTRALWFNGLVGLYGWVDTTFPGWVYNAALIPTALIAALFLRALYVFRHSLRQRLGEVAVYLAMSLGVLIVVGANDYLGGNPGEYREPRYLLPMLALWGVILALAARGAGRRWGPAVGAAIIVLFIAHDLFSQLLVISRFYG